MKKFNIVLKLILPLSLGLLLIAIASISSNYIFIKENITENSKVIFENITTTLEHITQKDKILMEGLIDELKKDSKSIDFFTKDNKTELFNYLSPSYEKFNEKYGITHFYIHNPNKINYLRVHNKKQNSDLIRRTTLDNAYKTLTISSGIEFGITHNLTLRVVSPWIVNGELIGFIELGKEVDQITEEYTSLTHKDIIFTLKKELITPEDFEKWKSKNHRNRHYFSMDSYYVIDSTIEIIEEELQQALNSNYVPAGKYITNNSRKYLLNSKDYFDINNNNVGKIFVLNDVTGQYRYLYETIAKVTFIVVILILIMLWYYAKYIKQTQSSLNEAYKEIQDISNHDGLTGLYNKKYYLESTPSLIKKYSRFDMYITFILVDVDNFKKYNDNYGHLKGDEVLQDIANTTMNTFQRDNEFCYRVGGEEFLIVTIDDDPKNGFEMAKVLSKNIKKLQLEHKGNGNFGIVTISAGVITRKLVFDINIEQLYDDVDKALYESKENGRDQVTLYDQ